MHSIEKTIAKHYDACVVGSGPAGMIAALLLAKAGLATVLVGHPAQDDPRTTTLMQSALHVLERIGVWQQLEPCAAALRVMRIVDATRRLIRAPDVVFKAQECNVEAFGYNIPNTALLSALHKAVECAPNVTIIPEIATEITPDTHSVNIAFASHSPVQAALVVGADGRHSPSRSAAGIAAHEHLLEQTAFVVNVATEKPHNGISTEFHTETGPFTVVPLPQERQTSIVAVVQPQQAENLMDYETAALGAWLGKKCSRFLGEMTPVSKAGMRRLLTLDTTKIAANRIALVGEAAHIFPPIGAQGLNLGVRDAEALLEHVVPAYQRGEDIGSDAVLSAYDRARRLDICSRSLAINSLNQSLLSPLLPAQAIRSAGLSLLATLSPLRQVAMRIGMGFSPFKNPDRSV